MENDPKEKFEQAPGSDQLMTPKPDYGEHTYKGSGKLAGKTAVITGRAMAR